MDAGIPDPRCRDPRLFTFAFPRTVLSKYKKAQTPPLKSTVQPYSMATVNELAIMLHNCRSEKQPSDGFGPPNPSRLHPTTFVTSLFPSSRFNTPSLRVLVVVFGSLNGATDGVWDQPTPVLVTGTVYQPIATPLANNQEGNFDIVLLTSTSELTKVDAPELDEGQTHARAVITVCGEVINLSHPVYDACVIQTEGGCEAWSVGYVIFSLQSL